MNAVERILCAAVWIDDGVEYDHQTGVPRGLIFAGWRHSQCIEQVGRAFPGRRVVSSDQGFLTSRGRFVRRAEAMKIAQAAGQVPMALGGDLYSEDLY